MMKNIKRFSAITIIGILFLVFNACEDSSEIFTISTPTAPVLAELSFSELELDAVNTGNPAITLNWDDADYRQQASINYAIQFSKDDIFTSPIIAATTTGNTTITLSVSELNSAAGNAGLNPFEWKTLYTRVVASLGSQDSEKSISNTIQLSVYPYFNYSFNDYYLVGNATAFGWDNVATGNNPPLFRDENDSNNFYYTGYFDKTTTTDDDGRFKIIENKGDWSNQWGTTYPDNQDPIETSGGIAGNPGTQDADPGRFGVTAAGYYTFEVNFASKKYAITSFDPSAIISPASLTIKGSSTTDIVMSTLAFDGHIWYVNNIRLIPGDITFTTNSGASWGSTTSFSGVATNGGGSIPIIVEDDYDVWFNDLTGRYILIPLNL